MALSWTNKPSSFRIELPPELPKIVSQMDTFICFMFVLHRRHKILGHISVQRTRSASFRIQPNCYEFLQTSLRLRGAVGQNSGWPPNITFPPRLFPPLRAALEVCHKKGVLLAESWQSGSDDVSPFLINVESLWGYNHLSRTPHYSCLRIFLKVCIPGSLSILFLVCVVLMTRCICAYLGVKPCHPAY